MPHLPENNLFSQTDLPAPTPSLNDRGYVPTPTPAPLPPNATAEECMTSVWEQMEVAAQQVAQLKVREPDAPEEFSNNAEEPEEITVKQFCMNQVDCIMDFLAAMHEPIEIALTHEQWAEKFNDYFNTES